MYRKKYLLLCVLIGMQMACSVDDQPLNQELNISIKSTAGKLEEAASGDVVILPNPFRNYVNIYLPDGEEVEIVINSKEGNYKRFTINTDSRLDMSALKSGAYSYEIVRNNKVNRKYLIKR